jgi:MFS family permease
MRRVFIVLTLTMACNGFIYTGLMHTMPKIFETGLSPSLTGSYTEIGLYVGAVIAIASACSVVGGWLADRYSARTIYVSCWLAMVVPVFVLTSTFGALLLAVAAVAMAFNAGFAAAENMLVAHYTPFRWRSLAYGAKFVLALGIGGLTVSLAGRTYEATGSFDLLYVLFTGAALTAALGAMMLPGRRAAPAEALGARA